MMHGLFTLAQQEINYFFRHIDTKVADQILEKALACQGAIFFSGVGKSGLIAKKICATMTSTGTRALYLSPINALHGDLGIVQSQDLFFILSKSGASQELLNLLPYLKNRHVETIAVVCEKNTPLHKTCNLTIELPVKSELCPFDLAPTTSTLAQMTFGDCLAIALMKQKQFTPQAFALNHPAGRLGIRSTLLVKDLMTTNLPLCKPQDSLNSLLPLMSEKKAGCLIITNSQQQLQGIFTDGDLRRTLLQEANPLEQPIERFMTKHPKHTTPQQLAAQALESMQNPQSPPISILPVIENEKVCGLIKLHDLIQSGL